MGPFDEFLLSTGVILTLIAVFVVLFLGIYSLLQISKESRRKRYVMSPSVLKDGDVTLHQSELTRDLTASQATMMGVGAMIGAGVFVLTGIAAGIAGSALLLVFALNGVVAILVAMVYAELGSAIPRTGGGFIYARTGFDTKYFGVLGGWMSWFAQSVAGSLYGLGFAVYFHLILHMMGLTLPSILDALIPVVAILIFLFINYIGSDVMGRAEFWISSLKVIILALFVVSGLAIIFNSPGNLQNFSNFFPKGYIPVLIAMGFTFVAFEGFEVIVQTGEEILEPRRDIPRAVIWCVLIVVPLYVFIAFVALGAISAPGMETWEFLSASRELGLLEAAKSFMPFGMVILLFGGLLSTLSALNASIYSSTRVAFALGRDRAFPGFFSKVSPNKRTPSGALITTGSLMVIMALIVPLEAVANAVSFCFLLLFLLVCVTSIRVRQRFSKELKFGFKTPFFPLVPILAVLGIILVAIVALGFNWDSVIITIAWLVLGSLFYFIYSGRKMEVSDDLLLPRLSSHDIGEEGLPDDYFTRLTRIFVPVSGKKFELDAVRMAVYVAHEYGATIVLYHFGNRSKEDFSSHIEQIERFNASYELIIEPIDHAGKSNKQDIVTRLVEEGSSGTYQLALVPSRRMKTRLETWTKKSVSRPLIEKLPLPVLQVFSATTRIKAPHFSKVAALISQSRRAAYLLQIAASVVSSLRESELWAYHFSHVPHIAAPSGIADLKDVQMERSGFLHIVGDLTHNLGVVIRQRFILAHKVDRAVPSDVEMTNVDLLVLGQSDPLSWRNRIFTPLSEKVVNRVSCATVVFHGR